MMDPTITGLLTLWEHIVILANFAITGSYTACATTCLVVDEHLPIHIGNIIIYVPNLQTFACSTIFQYKCLKHEEQIHAE